MHLCDACFAMRPILRRISSRDDAPLEWYKAHHDGFLDLALAMKSGCYICKKLWRNSKDNFRSVRLIKIHPATFYMAETAAQEGEDPRQTAVLKFYRKEKEDDAKALVLSDVFHYVPFTPVPRYLPSHSHSPAVLNLAQRWLNICQTSHKDCRGDADTTWYPTRLIRVMPRISDSRLVLTRGRRPRGDYATLSHCWGSKPIIRLVNANLAQLQRKIDLTTLPRTFQDAITLCRSLGLGYIWIDSLCIVRDLAELQRHGADYILSDTG